MEEKIEMAGIGTAMVEIEVGVQLKGGSVLLTVGAATQAVRLTTLVTELIESREGRFGMIAAVDQEGLAQVAGELRVAAGLIENRIELELSRARARGEAL